MPPRALMNSRRLMLAPSLGPISVADKDGVSKDCARLMSAPGHSRRLACPGIGFDIASKFALSAIQSPIYSP